MTSAESLVNEKNEDENRDRPNNTVSPKSKHPYDKDSCLSRLFHTLFHGWLYSVIKFGYKHDIQGHDCFDVPIRDSAEQKRELWKKYNAERKESGKKFSSASMIWRIERNNIIERFLTSTVAKLSGLSIPFIIKTLTVYFEDKSKSLELGVFYSFLLLCSGLVYIIVFNYAFVSGGRAISSIRSYIILMIYDKSLKMSLSASTVSSPKSKKLKQTTMGQKLNYVASDSNSIAYFVGWAPIMLANLVLAVAVAVFLFLEVGVSAFCGWAFMLAVGGPCQYLVGKKVTSATRKYLGASDVRVKFITELLSGIKVTKMYAWEYPLMDKISIYRTEEAKRLMIRVKYMALMSMMNIATPQFMALILFAVYIALGNELTLEKVFTVISLIQLLRIAIRIIPFAVMLGIGAHVGCKRMDTLFASTEQKALTAKNEANDYDEECKRDDDIMIEMKNASFKWNAKKNEEEEIHLDMNNEADPNDIELVEDKDFLLHDVSLQIKKGELVAIIGSVGSGKTSLISAMLGEIEQINGYNYKAAGDAIGYVSQQAFIVNGTVRSNILFGLEYDSDCYEDVIDASALSPDLEVLADGDLTEIGERGVNLSGGQKARISFARALYRSKCSQMELFLLDDPLSSVDVDVGATMFHRGICDVLQGKTILIVINSHLNLLKYCDSIIVMEDGEIVCHETYENVVSNGKYSHLLPSPKNNDNKGKSFNRVDSRRDLLQSQLSLKPNASYVPAKAQTERGKLTVAEKRDQGSVPWNIYGKYFSNAVEGFDYKKEAERVGKKKGMGFGVAMIAFEILLLMIAQGFNTTSDIWLSFYGGEKTKQRFPGKGDFWWLYMWTIFIVCLAVFTFSSSAIFGFLSIRSSVNLHSRTLWSVLRAPMAYFDATPRGQILNRFSKDTNEMDDQLQINFNNFAQNMMQVFGYLALIIYAVPYILVILFILFPLFYVLQRYFRRTARSLKRLEQITFTPIMNQFSESLAGLSTIRAYRVSDSFFLKMKESINANHSSLLTGTISMFWFGSNINYMSSFLLFAVSLIACYLSRHADSDTFDAALLSLSLVYSYSLTTIIQWTMNSLIESEKNFTAVQRLLHYESSIEKEAMPINQKYRPPNSDGIKTKWPNNGQLEIRNLSMRYRKDLDLVLKNITFTIDAGKKVGIVGRSGSGKSSLLLTLFRLVEPERPQSVITIDNVDCLRLGLQDLRKSLSIIPQDPVLFSGTLRFNLDPFEEYIDDEIWNVLKKIKLFELIDGKKDKLECKVAENGNNFSSGQKQLICIGRALLKKHCKFLLLDEATSSIDKHTDHLIQTLIRKEFVDKTVLCIAHRLQTVIDYDQILVMGNGKILEFDSPDKLLQHKNSIFAMMVNGKDEAISKL